MKKRLLSLLAVLLLVGTGGATFLALKQPAQRPPSDEKIELTSARIERGRYLAENLASCTYCHSTAMEDRSGRPTREGTLGQGGELWDESTGFAGKLYARNLTPDNETGLGRWTDGEILRAIREGVSRDGKALFALMPYESFAHLSDEDARSIVAYLRSLKPIQNAVPARELNPPLNIIVKFMPQPLSGPVAEPNHQDKLAYGKYLLKVGNCVICHSPVDGQHQRIEGKEFSGGQVFKLASGTVVTSANLTPHESGLAGKTRENFIAMFKAFAEPSGREIAVKANENTVMPWVEFAQLSEEDLGLIYDALRTVPPIANVVQKRGAAEGAVTAK